MAGVVLAAGAGSRLRPLTDELPKPLCPVGGVALIDLAIARTRAVTSSIAVNVHHGRDALEAHLGDRVHVSVEDEEALGTAGALGHLRDWVDGRAVVVVNADAWCDGGLDRLVEGWDGLTIRVSVPGGGSFGPRSQIAGALMPWADVSALNARPSGLYETSWSAAARAGRVEVVAHEGAFVDCGTPAQYLAANLAASGGASVIGEGADVRGSVERSVVWPGAQVSEGERLVEAVRTTGGATVLVRGSVSAAAVARS